MNNNFKEIFSADRKRNKWGHALLFVYFLRKTQNSGRLVQTFYRLLLHRMARKYGLEISWRTKIGKGFYLGHAYNITINPQAVIGEYCNLHKGVTIGQVNRGTKKGTPTIGDYVWIGVNATIVGNINIGSDVLIAPNSFVNCDIPSHSVVFGNPCQIKHRENATEGYINNI